MKFSKAVKDFIDAYKAAETTHRNLLEEVKSKRNGAEKQTAPAAFNTKIKKYSKYKTHVQKMNILSTKTGALWYFLGFKAGGASAKPVTSPPPSESIAQPAQKSNK